MKDFGPDQFTENDVLMCLDRAGLKYKNGRRYIVTQCPLHEDKNPSTQIFKNDWFVNCMAGCGRFHITKAFPELLPAKDYSYQERKPMQTKRVETNHYKQFDLMEWWSGLPLIPRNHKFKTIPLDILDELGWRWDKPKNSYFIPYFNNLRTKIPFAQWRHLSGERRFTFLKDAKPTCYGTWNLEPGMKIFVVEGTSDCAALNYAAVPCVAMPSASSGELMRSLAIWATKNAVQLVYAGDRDEAGNKLREVLDEVTAYRVLQPREPYKDWCDMLEAEGVESLIEYTDRELSGQRVPEYQKTPVDKVLDIFPGATVLEITDKPKEVANAVLF